MYLDCSSHAVQNTSCPLLILASCPLNNSLWPNSIHNNRKYDFVLLRIKWLNGYCMVWNKSLIYSVLIFFAFWIVMQLCMHAHEFWIHSMPKADIRRSNRAQARFLPLHWTKNNWSAAEDQLLQLTRHYELSYEASFDNPIGLSDWICSWQHIFFGINLCPLRVSERITVDWPPTKYKWSKLLVVDQYIRASMRISQLLFGCDSATIRLRHGCNIQYYSAWCDEHSLQYAW